MDNYIREDFDQIDVTYFQLEPTPMLPVPKKENCVKITGISNNLLLADLNKRSTYLHFKECSLNPVLITYENTDESAMGKNASAQKLKGMGSKAKGGNTLLGMLLLSSISTESEMIKAKGQVVVQFNKENAKYPFETEYFDSFYVKSDKHPEGKINIESEVISITAGNIWNNLEPDWTGSVVKLKFDVTNDYYEMFKWDLHRGDYSKAILKLDELQKNYPKHGDIFFHRAILNEYFRNYPKALADYQSAMKLYYKNSTLISSIERVQKEIFYQAKIGQINPDLHYQ